MNGLMAIKRYASGGPTFPADLSSYTGLQKAELYNQLRENYSDSELRDAAKKQFGEDSVVSWDVLTSYADNLKTLESIYQDIFERSLDPEGRDYWGTRIEGLPKSEIYQLVAGGAQPADQARLDPNEAAIASVKSIFAEQFGRQPTTAELNQYVGFLNDGRSTADISRELDRSLEGYNFDAERIEADYRNQFGRTADQEGFQYYMSMEDASAGKVNQKTITDLITGGAKAQDIEALAARPEEGYGVTTPLQLPSLAADPYGGRYATDLPYLSQAETSALFPGSESTGASYAAAETGIGLPQYYINIRNWFRDNPNATQAQVNEEAAKWGVSDTDIRAALNPEIGLVSKTLAGDLLKFTTPVTQQPVQSWFDAKGEFSAQAGPNVLQREDVDAAIDRALASGAINQSQVNTLNADLNSAKTWSEAYAALNKPKANVVLNELGVQVGEDVDANTALQEANARKELATAASDLLGGAYPSAVLQGQLAPDMKVDYPFSAEKMEAGYAGTTTKKGLADIFKNLGTELKFVNAMSNVNQTGLTPFTPLSIGTPGTVGGLRQIAPENIDFSKLAPQLRFATPQTNLITQAARPGLESVVRTLDQGTQRFGDRQAPLGAGQMSRGLRTAFEIGLGPSQYYENIRTFLEGNPNADAIAAAKEQYGVSDVDIQRALGETRAMQFSGPMTTQEKMRSYVGDVAAPDATLRGLQYVRNLGLNPEQATALWNQTYGTNFGPADYKRVMAEYGNLFGPAYERVPVSTVSGAAGNDTVGGGVNLSSNVFAATGNAAIGGPGGANARVGEGIPGVTFTDTPDAAGSALMPLPFSQTLPFGNEGQTPVLQPILTTTREGQPTAQDVENSRTSGIIPTIIGQQEAAEVVNQDFPTPMPGVPGDDEGSEDPVDVIGRYAGGPVMGSPQYFEEGGEVEPMRKYTPAELGSTFDISEYIDPDTGRFMINEYRRDVVFGTGLEQAEKEARARMTDEEREMAMRDLMIRQGRTGKEYGLPGITVGGAATGDIRPLNYYAEGGLADAARYGYAEELRQQGRNGDTILAHINPQEAAMLEAMGGSGTINPRTGLPEYGFSWKKLFKIGSMALPFLGLPPITTAIASGALAGASTPGKAFDFKRGLQVGLTSYMGAKAGEYLGKEMAARAATDTASKVAGATGPQIGGYGDFTSGQVAGGTQAAASATPTIAQQITSALPDVSQYIPATVNPISIGQSLGTVSAQSAADEAIQLRQAQQAIFDEEERKRKAMAQVFQEGSGNIGQLTYGGRNGGLIALAGGGAIDPVAFEGGGMTAPINQPRMLSGGGDGMSDSIPATIDGTQPARLADGEFVIPADVVADIGNGSSSAGAKRLYGMMDRVRTARHGTTKQPPEIKMNRLMPA